MKISGEKSAKKFCQRMSVQIVQSGNVCSDSVLFFIPSGILPNLGREVGAGFF